MAETLARPLASLTCPCLTLSLSAYTPRARRLAACIAGDVQLGVRLAHGSETRRLSWNALRDVMVDFELSVAGDS